jgi:hypothetical protein
VGLSGTLYLPAGYDKVKRKVALIWAYPTEYKDKILRDKTIKTLMNLLSLLWIIRLLGY